jgi:orotidine-5'-phosphate decarboxylase
MDQLLIALDVDAGARAEALVDRLGDLAGGFKIGSRLFTVEGPPLVRRLVRRGHRVFLDLKFHDIPSVVAGAVGAVRALGVWMVSVHASGGPRMLEAARRAAGDDAERPLVVAVTVLTSLDEATLDTLGIARSVTEQVSALARLARASGVDGVVASPREVQPVRAACGRDWLIIAPGVRDPTDAPARDDQARTATAREALEAGADYVVVGRPIIDAQDPREAAERLVRALGAPGLSRPSA